MLNIKTSLSTDEGTNTGTGTNIGTGTDTGTGTGTNRSAGTNTGAGTNANTGTNTSTDTKIVAGTSANTDTQTSDDNPVEQVNQNEFSISFAGCIITCDENQPTIDNGNGSWTLPGGGYIATLNGTVITAPPGTVITEDGAITFPAGSICMIRLKSGHSFKLQDDSVIFIDEETPLGYFVQLDNPFEDIIKSDWFYNDILFAYTHGLMVGISEKPMLFSPNTTTTRGMIVTLLYRLAGCPDVSDYTNPFNDVQEDIWYSDAVKWAAANGIVYGCGDGKYDPNANITRQDLAVILMRYNAFTGLSLPVLLEYTGFLDDADIANYAKEAVEEFFQAMIIHGRDTGMFDPSGDATRAEVAAMLHRFLEAVEGN